MELTTFHIPVSGRRPGPAGRPAFTLVELLVVMAVLGVLATLTVIAARKISRDTKLSLGTNTLVAALNEGRALAMKEQRDVLVAFRSQLEGPGSQYVEVVVAQWTGDSFLNTNGPELDAIDRFLPVPGIPIRRLPSGISVASPNYHRTSTDSDDTWRPMTYLPWIDPTTGQGELIGQPPGVMFAPDGSRILRNSHTDSARSWIDFNDDGLIRLGDEDHDPTTIDLNWCWEFQQRYPDDETLVSLAPFLAIYDFDDALERKSLDWSDSQACNPNNQDNVQADLTGPGGYITEQGNRFHFNRYSGVIMR